MRQWPGRESEGLAPARWKARAGPRPANWPLHLWAVGPRQAHLAPGRGLCIPCGQPMNPICVFEHEAIQEPLSGGEKTVLDRVRGPHRERMFEVGWREVKATSFVGVVQLGQRAVQVLPKMYRRKLEAERDRAECERQATANLLFLLSYTGKLRVSEPEIAQLTRQPPPLSEILFWIFARQLWQAVRRELAARLRARGRPLGRAQGPLAGGCLGASLGRLAARPLRRGLRRVHRG